MGDSTRRAITWKRLIRGIEVVVAAGCAAAVLQACSSAPTSTQAPAASTPTQAAAAPTGAPAAAPATSTPAPIAATAKPAGQPAAAPTKPVSMAVSTSRGEHYSPLWWCCGSQMATLPWVLMGLSRQNTQGMYEPWLASSVELDATGNSATIKLRPEAKWSDGQPITADDVVWTWELWTAPWIHGKGSAQSKTWGIAGSKEFNEGTTDTISGVQVVDKNTIVVKLDPPNAVWTIGQYMEYGILPKHVFATVDKDKLGQHPFLDAPTVSSGPFKFVKYELDQYIEMQRWDEWWGNSIWKQPQMTRVFAKQLNPQTRVAQLERGEVDLTELPGQEVERFATMPNVATFNTPSLGMTAYWFNLRKPYLQDKRIRQAMDFALDKQGILKTVNFGLGEVVATTVLGPDWAINPDVKPRSYDPEQAKALLKEAKWDANQKVTYLVVGSGEQARRMGEVFQQFMANVGIKVELKTITDAVALQEYDQGDFDVGTIGGGEFARDPSLSAIYFRSDTRWAKSWMGYNNPRVDELFKQGISTTDVKKRSVAYFELQQILSDELPWILLWQGQLVWGVNRQLAGYTPYVMTTEVGASLLDWYWP